MKSEFAPSIPQAEFRDQRGYFLLTVDVEDWFQVENLRPWNPPSVWNGRELRVEENTRRVLDLLDSFSENVVRMSPSVSPPGAGNNPSRTPIETRDAHRVEISVSKEERTNSGSQQSVTATFFVLGWIAKRLPNLVREIAVRGHEVASHGYSHEMCTELRGEQLSQDLERSKKLLEDILGAQVNGYRAPNFSVTPRILEAVRATGYRYDSSYNSFSLNARYGRIDFSGLPRFGSAFRIEPDFFEIPVSNYHFSRRIVPLGGGGYFRLFPWFLFRMGIRRILELEGTYMFYFHPWEIDPLQPKIRKRFRMADFKHYINISRTEKRLKSMLQSFSTCQFVSCTQYLKNFKK